MRTVHFTVDAKLLRELGERLVGKPEIALAELIKNSFDADARHVEIVFDGSTIVVADDGHGMSEAVFVERWMRIGTTHKSDQRVSPALGRPLTGSKGVGRLAAQLLAAEMELRSSALKDPSALTDREQLEDEIVAQIDWRKAVEHNELSEVEVRLASRHLRSQYANRSRHGTCLVLSSLNAQWGAAEFEGLARQIWALQPPFEVPSDSSAAFNVRLITTSDDVQESFDQQMTAIMEVATATISGELLDLDAPIDPKVATVVLGAERDSDEDGPIESRSSGHRSHDLAPSRRARVRVELNGGPSHDYIVEIADCQLAALDFEVRVFNLVRRQPRGITVEKARRYFADFGGVHIYDNGFRLPYYGPDADWLKLELDHARRLSRSQLLPDELQERNAMQNLPSNKRVFGVANISTTMEGRAAKAAGRKESDALAIQITRDRLIANRAFDQLRRTVRVGIDLYALSATQERARLAIGDAKPRSSPVANVASAIETVEALREEVPRTTYVSLRDAMQTVATELSTQEKQSRAYTSLLGSLATAGMTSLAYEHEIANQRGEVVEVARQLRLTAMSAPPEQRESLEVLVGRLQEWEQRADRIRALFSPLLDEESRTAAGRFKAHRLVKDVAGSLRVLARATEIDFDRVPEDLLLPRATYTAWSAILQNLLVNAFRATLEQKPARVSIDGGERPGRGWLRIQDNGSGGVDIETSSRLFLPFERAAAISQRAEILGLGGSGLGLTIVKMMTNDMGCAVRFVEPGDGWSTAVQVEWNMRETSR